MTPQEKYVLQQETNLLSKPGWHLGLSGVPEVMPDGHYQSQLESKLERQQSEIEELKEERSALESELQTTIQDLERQKDLYDQLGYELEGVKNELEYFKALWRDMKKETEKSKE